MQIPARLPLLDLSRLACQAGEAGRYWCSSTLHTVPARQLLSTPVQQHCLKSGKRVNVFCTGTGRTAGMPGKLGAQSGKVYIYCLPDKAVNIALTSTVVINATLQQPDGCRRFFD